MPPITDIHVHITPPAMFNARSRELIERSRPDLEEVEKCISSASAFLKFMDAAGVERAGVINYVSPDVIGLPLEVNEWAAKYCSLDPARLIAFGSVHPRFSKNPGGDVEWLRAIGIRALKIHPPHQLFAPNAYRNGMTGVAAIYEKAQALRMPVMIHTGTSIFPGARNVYAQPILADDIGVDFPGLTVILAHGGRPLWMAEAFFLVRRHANFYMDISGIPPQRLLEYFPRLEEIADKVLFGTDWPSPGVASIRGNAEKFRALPLSPAAQRKILYENAARLFPERA